MVLKRVYPISILLFFLLISRCSFAQLSVTDCSTLGLSPAQFVQNWLLGSGVTISNATFNGSSSIINSSQAGSFIATGNALTQMGLDSGMLLTSGEASIAIGPNDNCDAGFGIISVGDTDLTILADTITFDACVLEFDFIPQSDTVRFRYVFGSEEFFNFCHQFNDPFGFFLSGPGINGTFSNSSIDLAVMPGSSNYVTINNVCDNPASVWCNGPQVCGPPSMCQNSPPYSGTYYQDNALTYVFTAIHAVQACSTYHIKIAI